VRLLLALVLALPAGLVGEGAQPVLAAGDLDPSFGSGGTVHANFPCCSFRTLVNQPDGKLVAAGDWLTTVDIGGGSTVQAAGFIMARYNPNGGLDASFGRGGSVGTEFVSLVGSQNAVGQASVGAAALQADSKIVLAGRVTLPGNVETLALVRYNPDGSLDDGFGAGGKVIADPQLGFFFPDGSKSLAIQSDGKIVVGGGTSLSGTDFALVRFNPNGSLDGGFGTGGRVITDLVGGNDHLADVALQTDGKIIAAGTASYFFGNAVALVRYSPNGSLDSSFGSGGKVITDYGLPIPAQGGGVDPTFPVDGDGATTVVVQRDGKIIAAGAAQDRDHNGLTLTRYNPNGSLDTGFASGGTLFHQPGSGTGLVTAAVIQPNGKIVAAIMGPDGVQVFALVRINPNGSVDSAFGSGGLVTTAIVGDIRGLALQPDGKVVAVGGATYTGVTADAFVLARFLDDSVGGLGFGIVPQPSSIAVGWAPGIGQTGYLLARLPSGAWPLPGDATTYTDTSPAPGSTLNCYQVFPLGGSTALAASDALCALLGIRSQSGPPPGFALRLDESTTARLTWGSSGDQLGYVLLALPLGGSPRALGLEASARWATDQTGGVPTCYVLYAVYPAGTGNTDAVCAVPGQASFGATGPAAQATAAQATPTHRTVDGPQEAARSTAAPALEQQLPHLLQSGKRQVEQEAGKLRRKGR
jgi:uncharacterized delta-60 repeat protein